MRDASFRVATGSITGLIGPNGAGKSTTVGMISGQILPSDGGIRFEGELLGSLPAHRRARLGVVRTFQLAHEFGRLTTLENLLVAVPNQRGESIQAAILGRPYWSRQERAVHDRAMALLHEFGIEDKAGDLARNLSGGQKRLLEVMRALMAKPKLLLLDEPTAGLSNRLTERLERALAERVADGLTVLLIEHELGVVERLCSHVIVMADGTVLAQGPMAELRAAQEVQDAYLIG